MKAISVTGTRKYEPKAADLEQIPGAFVDVEDRAASLESTFLSNLGGNIKNDIERISPISPSIRTASGSTGQLKKYNSEKLLVSLYEIYDDMIEQFETLDYNNPIAKKMSDNIVKLGSCINSVGGEVDEFSPLDHVSGLSTPPLFKNAKEVVQRTLTCYKRAKIEGVNIGEDGKTIDITFLGSDESTRMAYKAKGTITAKKSWNGAEAIDYIYTPSSGKMSVKILEGTKWVDKSANYKIAWELQEIDLDEATDEDIAEFEQDYKKEGKSENTENKLKVDTENNNAEIDEEEINLDFSIIDK